MFTKVKHFIPLGVAITGVCGLVYLVAQQNMRIEGNSPQIQISQDAASLLASGEDVSKVVPPGSVEISKSLAPFVSVFDDSGKIIKSNAKLDGKDISIPLGVFEYTKKNTEDRITWQPRVGVRSAIVVNRWQSPKSSGFVVSGRSLTEIESQEAVLLTRVTLAWLTTLFATFISSLIFVDARKK